MMSTSCIITQNFDAWFVVMVIVPHVGNNTRALLQPIKADPATFWRQQERRYDGIGVY